MLAKMIDGKRFLYRGQHKKSSLANEHAEKLRRSGRNVRVIEKDGKLQVWATSMFAD